MRKKTISALILTPLTLFVLLLQSCPSPTPVSPPNPKTIPDKPGEIVIVKDSKGRVIGTITITRDAAGDVITKTLTVAPSVTSIPAATSGRGLLENRGLTGIDFSRASSLRTIGSRAFAKNKLTTVTIPASVTTIEAGAFADNRLTAVTIPNSVITIGNDAFRNNRLTAVTIPNLVATLGAYAFAGNRLTEVTIPSSVKTIEKHSFSYNRRPR